MLPALHAKQLNKRDGDRSPCPSSSPPDTGSTQQFTVSCNLDLVGDELENVPATSLLDCIDTCANYHSNNGRCEAVGYEASALHGETNCYLKKAVPTPVEQTFEIDIAVAIWPDTVEDCTDLSADFQAENGFQTHCGQDYPYNDVPGKQFNANSLEACIKMCAAQEDVCAGVSYEASMNHGYLNCYFKSAVGSNGLTKTSFSVDSAFLVQRNPSSSSAAATASPSLVPGILSSATAVSSSSSASSTQSPAPTSPTDSASPTASSTNNSSSKAWIAGAVLGPLVFLALITVLALYFYRRARGSRRESAPPPYMAQASSQGAGNTPNMHMPGHFQQPEQQKCGQGSPPEVSGRPIYEAAS